MANTRNIDKSRTITKVIEGIKVGTGDNCQVVDPDEVYRLASYHCNNQEIADWLGIKRDTLTNNFQTLLDKGRTETKQRLRQKQIQLALDGDKTMLIWLGKQILGQCETPQPVVEQEDIPQIVVTKQVASG